MGHIKKILKKKKKETEKDSRKSKGSGVSHVGFRFGFARPAPPFNNHMPLNGLPFWSLNPGLYLSEVYDKVHQMPALDLAGGKHVEKLQWSYYYYSHSHTRRRAEGALVIDGRGVDVQKIWQAHNNLGSPSLCPGL